MCGIAGVLAPDLNSTKRGQTATTMASALAHRGPDDRGVWSDEQSISLAHRRLAILDLSEFGHQPMISASGRYILSYNGEIYNFQDLRRRLEGEFSVRFRGHSDSEVLLAAVEAWGFSATLDELNGMFAIAIWDQLERRLWLARDRIGEKPLYYGMVNRRFYFASELSAFATVCKGQLNLNLAAIEALLRGNCIPAPLSIYREIQKLEPGHSLAVDMKDEVKVGTPHSYWSLPNLPEIEVDDSSALKQIEELLDDSVRRRMLSDVPLGAFLSGGVDSSLIAALMQKNSTRPIRTFTIGFENPNFDESLHARKVAAHLRTEHSELFLSDGEVQDAILKMNSVYSEPFSDSSQLPTYLLAALTRRHVTVALSGDGGDEIFAGYDRYATTLRMWQKIKSWPQSLRRPAGWALAAINPRWLNATLGWSAGPLGLPQRGRSIGEKLNKAGGLLAATSFEDFYSQMISQWQHPESILTSTSEAPSLTSSLESLPPELSLLRKMMRTDQRHYLPDDILVKVDRATMSVGLESRIPLLDHRLVELAARLPQSLLVREGERKWALKQILDRHVPRSLIERPKMGFGVPLGEWLRGPLRDWADDLLSEPTLKSQNIFRANTVVQKWQRHRDGYADYSHDLWPVLMFQSWQLEWG